MKKNIIQKRRLVGVALAALTITAGMSAIAFAGEPPHMGGNMPSVKMYSLNGTILNTSEGNLLYDFEEKGGIVKLKLMQLSTENRDVSYSEGETIPVGQMVKLEAAKMAEPEMMKVVEPETVDMMELEGAQWAAFELR